MDHELSAGDARSPKALDANNLTLKLLADIRTLVNEASQLHTEVRKVQTTFDDQQQKVAQLDHHIDELDSGLDKRMMQKIAEATPPATPRAAVVPSAATRFLGRVCHSQARAPSCRSGRQWSFGKDFGHLGKTVGFSLAGASGRVAQVHSRLNYAPFLKGSKVR